MSIEQPISILFRGGRLPAWYQLPPEKREPIEQAHVDLMLAIASQFKLRRLEGFRLVTPQEAWERFWIIEFPTLVGAEAWIEAEIAPEYGSYGFFDYHLGRQILLEDRLKQPAKGAVTSSRYMGDPHQIPPLSIETDCVVVLINEWDESGRGEHLPTNGIVQTLAREYGSQKIELFKLMTPKANWDRVWVVELRTLSMAEQFIEAVAAAGQADRTQRRFQLSRKWAPAYFESWLPA